MQFKTFTPMSDETVGIKGGAKKKKKKKTNEKSLQFSRDVPKYTYGYARVLYYGTVAVLRFAYLHHRVVDIKNAFTNRRNYVSDDLVFNVFMSKRLHKFYALKKKNNRANEIQNYCRAREKFANYYVSNWCSSTEYSSRLELFPIEKIS